MSCTSGATPSLYILKCTFPNVYIYHMYSLLTKIVFLIMKNNTLLTTNLYDISRTTVVVLLSFQQMSLCAISKQNPIILQFIISS